LATLTHREKCYDKVLQVRGHKSTLLLGDKTFKVLPKLLWDCDAVRTGYCTTNADVVQTEAADAPCGANSGHKFFVHDISRLHHAC